MSDTTTVNWREMPAGLELDRVVAEAMGWKIIEDVPMVDMACYRVFNADGIPQCREIGYFNRWTEYDLDSVIPHYSTDLNAAITLYDGLPDGCNPSLKRLNDPGSIRWSGCMIIIGSASPDEHGILREIHEYATTPAHAVVLAWLAWKEGEKGTVQT